MVFSYDDPTDVAVQKMIQAHRAKIMPQNNLATNRHLELQIATLEKAPRDAKVLQSLICKKEQEKERSTGCSRDSEAIH